MARADIPAALLNVRTVPGRSYAKINKCAILESICGLIEPISRPTLVGVKPYWVHLCGSLEFCPPLGKGIRAVAELGGDNVDDWLGIARVYFCALRNVEGTTKKIEELQVRHMPNTAV